MSKAGRSSEVAYQTENKMRALATDIEYALVVNSASSTGSSAGARGLKGIRGWVSDNVSTGASAGRALTAAILDTVLQLAWADGGNPDVLLMGGFQKIGFINTTNFPGVTREISADAEKLNRAIEVYRSPFGMMKLVLSHVLNSAEASTLFVLDMRYWHVAFLRPIMRKEFDAGADGRQFAIRAEYTLESNAEASGGAVKQLTTS